MRPAPMVSVSFSRWLVPNQNETIMKTTHYALFSQPITRRTYTWLLFLCPWAALFLLLSSRQTGPKPVSLSGRPEKSA